MSYQALVKTTRSMQGHYTYDFATAEARSDFATKSPGVWWYFYPEAGDDFFPGSGRATWDSPRSGSAGWRKGGAWDVQPQDPGPGDESPAAEAPAPEPGDRW